MRLLMIAAAFVLVAAKVSAETLTVYTYDSFTAEWGPGPKLTELFEARCGCMLELVGLEDAVSILSRIRLEGPQTRADVALGLDTSLIAEAQASRLFTEHGLDLSDLDVPGDFSNSHFVPYDHGFFAFVYDSARLATPPASMKELVEGSPDISLLVQDPRTSSPGLGLMLWMRKLYGDDAGEAWEMLRPRIVTVTQGWSEAYGLFQKGEADMVLSYTTSPAYHITAEDETKYRAAPFAEGHYQQIEVAGRLASSPHGDLAKDFLEFLISEQAQAVIPATQWMYPVRDVGTALPESFSTLVEVETPLAFSPGEVLQNRKGWVAEWRDALSK